MKIYIPRHLLKLPLINNLARLIQEYSSITQEEEWEDKWLERNDPVLRFLNICIKDNMIPEGQDREAVITYLSHLFYSVKGTVKVLEYVRKFLGIDIIGDIYYDVNTISIHVTNITQTDEVNFVESFKAFLEALLHFRRFDIEMDGADIIVESSVFNNIGGKIQNYCIFSPQILEL